MTPPLAISVLLGGTVSATVPSRYHIHSLEAARDQGQRRLMSHQETMECLDISYDSKSEEDEEEDSHSEYVGTSIAAFWGGNR